MTDTTRIPQVALALALAGLLPFLWGAATMAVPGLAGPVPPRLAGPQVQVTYGVVILCFMAGVFWGFAARSEGPQAWLGYVLSVIPALYIFFNLGTTPRGTATSLVFGFLGLLAIDWHFWRAGMAPRWWMWLRLPVTGVVLLTLIPVILL